MKKRQGFINGAATLAGAMLLVKLAGALYKIPLKHIIGEYGFGLYNVAYSFYAPVFSLATVGFPAAVARLVSEKRAGNPAPEPYSVRRAAFPLFLSTGAAGTLMLTLFAPFYCSDIIGAKPAIYSLLALSPAILVSCAASVYRGWFEGLSDMRPTAASQVTEAVIKLALGLFLSRFTYAALFRELEAFGTVFGIKSAEPGEGELLILAFSSAAAVLGVTAGTLGGLCCLVFIDAKRGRPKAAYADKTEIGKLRRRLIGITLPIAAGAISTNIAGLIDAAFLQNRLLTIMNERAQELLSRFEGLIPDAYLSSPQSVPTFLYGCYTLAATVYLLVPSLTQPIAVSALPAVTRSWTRKSTAELNKSAAAVIKSAVFICFPAGMGLSAVAGPAAAVLYGDEPSTQIVSGVLRILGIASVFAAMAAPMASIFQAVGRADLPVKLLVMATAIKLFVNYFLCAVPEWNIYGATVGTLLCYAALFFSEFFILKKRMRLKLSFTRLVFVPLLCACLCGGAAGCASSFFEKTAMPAMANLLVSVLIGAVYYFLACFSTGFVKKNRLKTLLMGQKIAKTLEKRKRI